MIIWWITEAIHVYAISLLPLGLMPVMGYSLEELVEREYDDFGFDEFYCL
jgi:hypothetical protein